MEWRKPSNKRFTDLCIWIDANIEKLRVPGEYPEVENKIYNYLWLLVKALAIKKCMFQKFDDYDPYSFYAANRLFFALRKNLQNQGKKIKGKEIRPIKSCLNYTKALLSPMRIEYQREAYREILDDENISKKFDAVAFKESWKDAVKIDQGGKQAFIDYTTESFKQLPVYIEKALSHTPFAKNTVEYKRLKISLLLTIIGSLKTKKKFDTNAANIVVWKLPKSISSYIKIILSEVYTTIKKEIIDCYQSAVMDDATTENIINYKEGNDYDYDN